MKEADNMKVLYEIHNVAVEFYQNYLQSTNAETARQYLHSRQIMKETIQEFSLGASSAHWDDLYRYLTKKGFSHDDLLKSGLIGKNKNGKFYDRFRSRIMFPICNLSGQVIGFTGRLYENVEGAPKYLNSSETAIFKKRETLYGFHLSAQWSQNVLMLVEGTLDVIALRQAGFCNAVAPLGTALTEEQMAILAQHTKDLIVCFDGDDAGKTATRKAMALAANAGLKVRAVTLPKGRDPMEFVQTYGTGAFSDLLVTSQTPLAYELSAAEKACDITNDESLIQFLQTAAKILAKAESRVAVEVHAGSIAQKYGISKDVMLAEIRRYRRKFKKERDVNE